MYFKGFYRHYIYHLRKKKTANVSMNNFLKCLSLLDCIRKKVGYYFEI